MSDGSVAGSSSLVETDGLQGFPHEAQSVAVNFLPHTPIVQRHEGESRDKLCFSPLKPRFMTRFQVKVLVRSTSVQLLELIWKILIGGLSRIG